MTKTKNPSAGSESPLLDFGPFGLTAKADASGVDLKVREGWGEASLRCLKGIGLVFLSLTLM